ncbi:MAG: DEAD/DEAH box helicase [Deltaproteobacteria bacterium]|nr:DEAD/DEAH box helicase [Deltaproteobacteria bacterium]
MTLKEFIEFLRQHPDFERSIVHYRFVPPKPPGYGTLPSLSPCTLEVLKGLGISRLYSHQVTAVELMRQGKNVVVATPTASGKSLIYNIVVFEEIMKENNSKALYLFPLKALEQDQMKNLQPWLRGNPQSILSAEIYDGDTTPYRRKKIRDNIPHILFSNPDMLHRGILAYHAQWKPLLANLRLVVLDEVHTYRGIFGSHVNQRVRTKIDRGRPGGCN